MKTPANYIKTTILGLALAAASVAWTASALEPVKGGERMLQSGETRTAQAVWQSGHSAAACSMCGDEQRKVADASAKGFDKTRDSVTHRCPTCGTRFETKGMGKAASQTAAHTCAMRSSEMSGCCGAEKL